MTAATFDAGVPAAARFRVCPTTGLKVFAQAESLIKAHAVCAILAMVAGEIGRAHV